MKQIPITNLDLTVHTETLDNGLKVYIIPDEKVNGHYVTFSTNYGSIQNEFVPIGEKKMVTVPHGIAHFLEHKMFDKEDGIDPFQFFNERGSDANANTNYYKTTYLYSGTDCFEENLNFLLDYVQNPYFTDETVQKEKGIIEQEIKMYQDDPYTRLFEGSIYNSFVNHPIKHPIIGSIPSINSITKEDLFKCYNTFYHPSNMFVVVTGNIDEMKTIDIIRKNQASKKIKKLSKIKLNEYNEPDKVSKAREEIELNVVIPKFTLTYKINIRNIENIKKRMIISYLAIMFDIKLGTTSRFYEQVKNEGLVTNSIDINYINTDDHVLFMLSADSKDYELLIDKIKKELKNLAVLEEEFERKKRIWLSDLIFSSQSIYKVNNKLMNSLTIDKEVPYNQYEDIKKMDLDTLNEIVEKINLKNSSLYLILPKK